MFGILWRAEIRCEERKDFINFIKWDIQVAKEREPGTLRFDLYQDPNDENAFFVYEAYRDETAFEEHQKNEPYRRWDSDIRWRMLKAPHQKWFKADALSSLTTRTTTTDIERAFRTKDYELKANYLTGQFNRMWQRFQFFITIQTALVGGKTVFGERATIPLALVGAVVSVVWFIIGAEDRYLVTAYRLQADDAGKASARCMLPRADAQSYEAMGQLKPRSPELKSELQSLNWVERLTEWRREEMSITRLPAWLAVLALVGWLSTLIAHFIFK
jgi:(4S)-4-hydroxy-5-phosphonooxypentane-2,3-dione isomerase